VEREEEGDLTLGAWARFNSLPYSPTLDSKRNYYSLSSLPRVAGQAERTSAGRRVCNRSVMLKTEIIHVKEK
jgi:hypothetical protein